MNAVTQFGQAKGTRVGTDEGTVVVHERAHRALRRRRTAAERDDQGRGRRQADASTARIRIPIVGGTGRYKSAKGMLYVGAGEERALNVYELEPAGARRVRRRSSPFDAPRSVGHNCPVVRRLSLFLVAAVGPVARPAATRRERRGEGRSGEEGRRSRSSRGSASSSAARHAAEGQGEQGRLVRVPVAAPQRSRRCGGGRRTSRSASSAARRPTRV